MPLGMEVGLGPGDFVLDGDPTPLPKMGRSPPLPNFRPMSIVAKRLDGSRWHLVQDALCQMGTSSPPSEKGRALQFSAHVCCGQTAVCVRIPLGTELGLSLCDIVLDGDPVLLPYQVASSSIQPFGHNRHGRKIGWGGSRGCAFFWGSWVPIEHKVAWAEAYLSSSTPIGILVHPAV